MPATTHWEKNVKIVALHITNKIVKFMYKAFIIYKHNMNNLFIFKRFFSFKCMSEPQNLGFARRRIRSLRTRTADGFKLPCGCWEPI